MKISVQYEFMKSVIFQYVGQENFDGLLIEQFRQLPEICIRCRTKNLLVSKTFLSY